MTSLCDCLRRWCSSASSNTEPSEEQDPRFSEREGPSFQNSALMMSLIEKNEDAYFSKQQIRYYERIYQDERVEAPQPIVRYQIGEVIGYGSFGQVSRALNRDTGQLLAVKQVPLPR